MPDEPPDLPPSAPVSQTKGVDSLPPAQSDATIPANGRQAFRDIRRQLSEQDLSSTGVQKLLLDELERAEARCEVLNGYVERFHMADKRAAILEEQNRTVVALEIIFAVGIGVGCAIIGLAPLFWADQPKGYLALAIGVVLIVGSSIARMVKR
jgi:hypothetical protein